MIFHNIFKGYSVVLMRSAQKDLHKLPAKTAYLVEKKLAQMVLGAGNADVLKLVGYDALYRLRIGDYRVIFEVHEQTVIVLVISVKHRREVYQLEQ